MSRPEALVPVPDVDPGTAGPPCAYARLRAEQPVVQAQLPNGETGWLISRYEDVRAAFADPRLVRPLLSAWPPREGADAPPPALPTFLEMTGEHHERVRRAVLPMFGRRQLEFMRPRIRAMAGELVDAMVAGTADGEAADLVTSYAEPLPLRVLRETVGLPYEDREIYLPHTLTLLGASGLSMEEVLAALYALQGLRRRPRLPPGEGPRGRGLHRAAPDGSTPPGWLTEPGRRHQLRRHHAHGGLQDQPSSTPATPCSRCSPVPDQLRRLREAPEGIGTAAEELLRYVPLMNAINILVATEDFTLHGQRIRAGAAVVPVPASANRDPEQFVDADHLDLARTPNAHVAFGHGPHSCMGGHLTRLQLAIAIEVLLERLPGIELAVPAGTIPWDESTPLRAPAVLPVRW